MEGVPAGVFHSKGNYKWFDVLIITSQNASNNSIKPLRVYTSERKSCTNGIKTEAAEGPPKFAALIGAPSMIRGSINEANTGSLKI